MSKMVLVTGGSGFIASCAIVELLRRGYAVRTTVRKADQEPLVRAQLSIHVDAADQLSFAVADLTSDAGWDAAVEGCDYILHIAAPVGVRTPRNPDDLIVPTRDGAVRVLRAACRAKVPRVVMTSAIEACRPRMTSPDGVIDETRWTDVSDTLLGPYRLAKTLAEQAAWDVVKKHSVSTTLTTILPSAVLGPVLGTQHSNALQLVQRMFNGSMPRYPNIGFCVVDVRDVVDLHIRAMTSERAANERFIAASDWMWMSDIAALLRHAFGAQASRVPTKALPDTVLRIVAMFNRDAQFIVPLIQRKHVFTSKKAATLLNWQPRPARATLVDSARSAIGLGAIKLI